MRIRSNAEIHTAGTPRHLKLPVLLLACLILVGCGASVRTQPASSPTPEATATPDPTLSLTVVQTVHNSYTGQQTESVFTEIVADGESYTVKNMSGNWSLTFSLTLYPDKTVTVTTARPMLPYDAADDAKETDTFTMEVNVPCRISEPVFDRIVWYTFTFTDPVSSTPIPDDGTVVQFRDRYILSNIRRTLHESRNSAFTTAQLELILFVELKGKNVQDISELSHLPNIETLTLRDTCVTDLRPLAGCEKLHTLVLLENNALDLSTLPPLPSLKLLSLTGNHSKEDILALRALLPVCNIVAETEN